MGKRPTFAEIFPAPKAAHYAADVFGTLGRRAVESLVGLFALLGFAFVPLGSKTGLEHAVAVMGTPSVREAASGLVAGVERARGRLLDVFAPGRRDTAPLPLPSSTAPGRSVRPVVPELLPGYGTTR